MCRVFFGSTTLLDHLPLIGYLTHTPNPPCLEFRVSINECPLPAHALQRCLSKFVSWPQDVSMVLGFAPADHWDQLLTFPALSNERPIAQVDQELCVGYSYLRTNVIK